MHNPCVFKNSLVSFLPVFTALMLLGCNSGDPSSPEEISTESVNTAPTANAGIDQTSIVAEMVYLDGNSSTDSDGDSLSYQWSISTKPQGSSASLIDDVSATPSLSADVEGDYVISLVVNDGTTNSETDQVTIVASAAVINLAPVANEDSIIVSANTATIIQLNASDNEDDLLSYQIESSVENGVLTLNGDMASYTANNNFIGSDSFTFSVSDGNSTSNIATITIEVLALDENTTLLDGTIVETRALVNLGSLLYQDTNLSNPVGQSCASCHDLALGFDDPNSSNPTSVGADGISFGTRNSPTASYSAHIPAPQVLQGPGPGGGLVGGLFLDGRADSLEEQAKGPFLNAIEMGNASEQEVIDKVANSTYAAEFQLLFGESIFDDSQSAYNYIADAIAAFERTTIFSPFTAKFDRVQTGEATFTAAESRGQNIFNNKGDCQRCHQTNNGAEVFSDFTYKNIGTPSNPQLPALIADPSFVDLGLGGENGNARNNGEFRVSTLRNIVDTAPYMHNGVFTTLREVIDFYNTRDTSFVGEPEVNQNIDQGGRIGELNLTENEIDDLIAFLATLSDE